MKASQHGCGLAPLKGGDRREAAPVFVAKGQGEQEISDGPESFARQAFGPSGADAGNPGDRIAQAQREGRSV